MKRNKMNTYGVKILFQNIIENENRRIYEESVQLFHAESSDEAFEKAEKLARESRFEYTNIYGKKVTYKLYDSIEAFIIYDDISFKDGAEVFSTIFEMKNPSNDPIECRYNACTIEEMLILRNIEFN